MPIRLAVIPDTQTMAKHHPNRMRGIGDWIAANADRLDAVMHVGDVVDDGERDLAQLVVAGTLRSTIGSAGLPYFVAAGNHDDDQLLAGERRSLTAFTEHVAGDGAWIAGRFPGPAPDDGASNHYGVVTVGRSRLLVVVLEFGPRPQVVAWAGQVLDEHAATDAIVLTHAHLTCAGERMVSGDRYHPSDYAATRDGVDGDGLWTALRRHPNLRAIFCGHQIPDNIAYRVDVADGGHGVLASFQNWQCAPEGGGGRIRLVHWDPETSTMALSVINTATGQLEHEPGFDLSLDLSSTSTDLGTVFPGPSVDAD